MAVDEPVKGTDSTPAMDAPAPSLVKKLAEVMALAGHVQKSGYNTFHKYKYVQESDLTDAVRQHLADRNVIVLSDILESSILAEQSNRSGNLERITHVRLAMRFIDGDSGEELVTHVEGTGIDGQDKGLFKAVTGAVKYGIMKSFLISTGDDPERDSPSDTGAPARAKKPRDPGKLSNEDMALLTDTYTAAEKAGVNVRDMPNAKGVHTLAEFQESMQWLREQLKEAQGA